MTAEFTAALAVQVSGLLLPKGTEMMLPAWTLHYNRRVWGDDAGRWRPDRWLEGGSVAAARKDAEGNPRFMPFLDGPSNCIGQHLALVRCLPVFLTMPMPLHQTHTSSACIRSAACGGEPFSWLQSEIKMVIATLLSRLTLKMDAQRMGAMQTVDDFVAAAVTKVTLQQQGATWLRMGLRAPPTVQQAVPAA